MLVACISYAQNKIFANRSVLGFTPKSGWDYDLRKAVKDLPAVTRKPTVLLQEGEVVSCRALLEIS